MKNEICKQNYVNRKGSRRRERESVWWGREEDARSRAAESSAHTEHGNEEILHAFYMDAVTDLMKFVYRIGVTQRRIKKGEFFK